MRTRTLGRGRRLGIALVGLALAATACGGNGDGGDSADGEGASNDGATAAEDAGGGEGVSVDAEDLEIVTAPTGSIFYPLGSAIATQLEGELGLPVTAAPSAGSGENVTLLGNGDTQLGIVASNAIVPAFSGNTPYEEPIENLRPLAHMFPNGLIVFARKDSGIESVADLEGKRVGVGLEARTWDHFISPLFESQGLVYNENMTPVYAGFSDMANQVRDGQLDAAIGTGGSDSPSPAITALAAEVDLTYLEWDEQGLEQVAEELPYINTMEYPGEVLDGYGEETYFTADIGGPYLTASSDMSADTAYEVTRVFHENLEQMAGEVAVMKWIAEAGVDNLVQPLGDVPFHEGAVRYWQEVGAMD